MAPPFSPRNSDGRSPLRAANNIHKVSRFAGSLQWSPTSTGSWRPGTTKLPTPDDIEKELQLVGQSTSATLQPARPGSAHSRPGLFALTVAPPGRPRPGSARPSVRPFGNRPGYKRASSAIEGRSWVAMTDGNESQKKPPRLHGFSLSQMFDAKPLRFKSVEADETVDEAVREAQENARDSKLPADRKDQAGVARAILMMKRTLMQRQRQVAGGHGDIETVSNTPRIAHKRSMHETCLRYPNGYEWSRPRDTIDLELQASDNAADDGDTLLPQDLRGQCFNVCSGRPASPTVEDVQSRLQQDAKRFEKIYAVHPEVDTVDLYGCSRSATPSTLPPCGSPSPDFAEGRSSPSSGHLGSNVPRGPSRVSFYSDLDSLQGSPWPTLGTESMQRSQSPGVDPSTSSSGDSLSLKVTRFAGPADNFRASSPDSSDDQLLLQVLGNAVDPSTSSFRASPSLEVALRVGPANTFRGSSPYSSEDQLLLQGVEHHRPPEHLVNRGRYSEPVRIPDLQPFYRSPVLGEEGNQAIHGRPPKFSAATIRRWFETITGGEPSVCRRQLLFALNESEELFGTFCAAQLHADGLDHAADPSEGLTIGNSKHRYTQESFARRLGMLREGLDLLDRIQWERDESKTAKTSHHKHSGASLSRMIDFEVVMIYFKYMDMLLGYIEVDGMNFQFERDRTKAEIHSDCQLEDTDRSSFAGGDDSQSGRRRPCLRKSLTSKSLDDKPQRIRRKFTTARSMFLNGGGMACEEDEGDW